MGLGDYSIIGVFFSSNLIISFYADGAFFGVVQA